MTLAAELGVAGALCDRLSCGSLLSTQPCFDTGVASCFVFPKTPSSARLLLDATEPCVACSEKPRDSLCDARCDRALDATLADGDDSPRPAIRLNKASFFAPESAAWVCLLAALPHALPDPPSDRECCPVWPTVLGHAVEVIGVAEPCCLAGALLVRQALAAGEACEDVALACDTFAGVCKPADAALGTVRSPGLSLLGCCEWPAAEANETALLGRGVVTGIGASLRLTSFLVSAATCLEANLSSLMICSTGVGASRRRELAAPVAAHFPEACNGAWLTIRMSAPAGTLALACTDQACCESASFISGAARICLSDTNRNVQSLQITTLQEQSAHCRCEGV